jgi:DnaK suppressor protein
MKKATLKKCEELLRNMKKDILASLQERAAEGTSVENEVQDEGDIAQEASAKSVILALAEKDKSRLMMIDQALQRINDGTYGVCIDTEEEIEEKRLLANPLALRTITAQESFERDQKQRASATRSGGSNMFGGDDD